MKIWTSEHVFNHSWETVVQAAWRKYPNPMNPAVLGTDVIDRKVVDGVLHTHRLVTSEWGLPGWARSIVGPSGVCYASENSEVDPKTREMKLQTRNLSFGSLVAVDEKLTYQPCPNDSSKTLLKQEAIVTVHGVPLSNYLENMLTNNISCNASKGRQAIEWVITKIETEMTDLKNSAVKNKDEIITQTRKSIDDFRSSTRKTLDEMLFT
ncbi:hypothetical protein V9T40_002975 [Parthenolecanium corni]|uniref:PRELI/MSF1 domain-containing protein n=1 Tax=Parthenolecanium corni TaxID=536013 RepID=A0AAN9Y8G2_9HEMI